MEKVIPPGLNYADIKPEAIENQIRMIKFLPMSNIQNQKANDVVRFNLQGNGFFDPYSAYIKIRVSYDMTKIPDPDCLEDTAVTTGFVNGVFLDRSAHSLINRLVIRSQGTELERIEQYDVLASMINDMVYSSEQRQLHHYEGFATRTLVAPNFSPGQCRAYDAMTLAAGFNNESPDPLCSHFGDRGFYKLGFANDEETKTNSNATIYNNPLQPIGIKANGQVANVRDIFTEKDNKIEINATDLAVGKTVAAAKAIWISPTTMEFCIPIYSGIIGVLMADKKLLPLSLLPLEVEFTMNPQAFYPVGKGQTNRSAYTIDSFEIWTHTLFFEQELHRSLEAVVAENGIFIHYTSFYLTPINTYNNNLISKYHQLGCFLKSVEAIHWVFLYTDYQTEDGPRKLNFVSHNLYNLQLRNGMDLIPSEPLLSQTNRGSIGAGARAGSHHQLLIETYKAWNKMHDPLSDGAINAFNYNIDQRFHSRKSLISADQVVISKPETVSDLIVQQQRIGRCQYGLSLVGEEIGQSKTIVTGKKTVLPFDLNFDGTKVDAIPSMMLSYLRADFILYVRPDLVVTRLGL